MATDIAARGNSPVAVKLLSGAQEVGVNNRRSVSGDYYNVIQLDLPLELMDLLDGGATQEIIAAAKRCGITAIQVTERLAPTAPGWRDRLAELDDWGTLPAGDAWSTINDRVHDLRTIYTSALTTEERMHVGQRCRELIIAATNATYRQLMAPKGEAPPKGDDVKTQTKQIMKYLRQGSLDDKVATLLGKAIDTAHVLTHARGDPSRVGTFAAAQATVLAVRTLGVAEDELRRRGLDPI